MFVKMNIWNIVKGHFGTFRDATTKKISKGELFLYLFLPFFLSFIIIKYVGFALDKDNANIFLTAFSIFAGLLFNMLLLIFDILDKTKNSTNSQEEARVTEERKMKVALFHETFLNISFTVLVSVCIVIMLMVFFLFFSHLNSSIKIYTITLTLKTLISFLIVALIIMFLMSFLMILKRFNILLSREL